jgi:hypothetical protein
LSVSVSRHFFLCFSGLIFPHPGLHNIKRYCVILCMNQPQPAPEFSWDASLRQALSALRDCLEEARQNNEPLELLDRDVLLDDLRACYRIISVWPTRQATPALPGIALPSAAEPPAAEPPAALPSAASNEDFVADDSVSEDDLEQSMGDDLEPSMGDDLAIADNTAATQIEWIVGDPPLEEDQEEDIPEDKGEDTSEDKGEDTSEDKGEDTSEDKGEDTAEGGRLSIDATFSAEETLTADEPFLEMSEEERGHEAAIEEEATNEFEPVDETGADIEHEAAIVQEATNELEPVDETGADIEHAASIIVQKATNEFEPVDEPKTADELEATTEAKEPEPTPAERTQRTEWYTPSLFELSTDHPTTPHTQEDPGSITAHNDHLMSAGAENRNSEAAVVGGPSRIEQLIQSSKDGAARLADARLRPVTDIKKGLGLNEKFLLMRSFFNNDAMRFTADLDQLNRLNSLQEAEEILFGNLLPGRHWDAQSEADLTLFLIIYRRFSAR